MRDHTKAVVTALKSDRRLTVYLAEVPDKPVLPYVVVYPDPGIRSRSSLVAVSDRIETVVQLTAVGATPDQAEATSEVAASLLLDETLTIAGRSCNPVTQEAAQPIRRDDQVNPHTFYAVTVYRVTSVPS